MRKTIVEARKKIHPKALLILAGTPMALAALTMMEKMDRMTERTGQKFKGMVWPDKLVME